MVKMTEQIKKCPFCGSVAENYICYDYGDPAYWVECTWCSASIREKTEKEAIKKWNQRS